MLAILVNMKAFILETDGIRMERGRKRTITVPLPFNIIAFSKPFMKEKKTRKEQQFTGVGRLTLQRALSTGLMRKGNHFHLDGLLPIVLLLWLFSRHVS